VRDGSHDRAGDRGGTIDVVTLDATQIAR